MKIEVFLSRETSQTAQVVVEVDSPDEAEAAALKKLAADEEGAIEWVDDDWAGRPLMYDWNEVEDFDDPDHEPPLDEALCDMGMEGY